MAKYNLKANNTMGKRIRLARQYAKITQTQLADAVGVSLRQVQFWENDENEPGANKISLIADATDVTVNYLLGDFPRMPTTWTPLYVIKITDEEHTLEEAKRLLEQATGNEYSLEDLENDFAGGWFTWENGALVQWEDGGDLESATQEFIMLVK